MSTAQKRSTKKNATAGGKTGNDLKLDLYDKLIASHPQIERKGAANPYTSLHGNMFTLLHDSRRLAIRLPPQEREKFLKKHQTTLFEAYGAVMKEYVAVPDSLLKNTNELQKYFELSFEYAKTLKPKATKRKA
jgi:TfoX/Sxy family transcriptional regulator of competence genes